MGIVIKYANDQTEQSPIYIDNAERAEYKCYGCSDKLIPVKGEARKKEWHFRHYQNSDCAGGLETAIHKLAKKILVNNIQIKIPGQILNYSDAKQEKGLGTIIPDVTVSTSGKDVHFEIEVTHVVDASKESFYKSGLHQSVKINLARIPYDINPSDLENIILHETHNKKKIYWKENIESGKSRWKWLLFFFTLIAGYLFFKRSRRSH